MRYLKMTYYYNYENVHLCKLSSIGKPFTCLERSSRNE